MMLRNNWYVAAFSKDVAAAPVARTICGEPVVLFRSASGAIAALEDRCSHRGVPLSAGGECVENGLRCPYHGLEFSPSGACVKIPGQVAIPPATRIVSYPVVERDELIWIWVGQAEQADLAKVPAYQFHSDPAWAWSPTFLKFECNWVFLNDNLLDLTHLGFIHRTTIGGDADAHANAETSVSSEGRAVFLNRRMPDREPPPYYGHYKFKGRIDRWQEVEFTPGFIRFWTGGLDVNTGAYEGRRVGGVQLRHMHAITPSTEASLYYHFTFARNFLLDNAQVHKSMQDGAFALLHEDKAILEAQQVVYNRNPGRSLLGLKSDAAGIQARRIVERLLAEENETASVHAAA